MIVEKDISQLAEGSYVVRIVRQRGNYELKKPGWVRDFKAIEALIHHGVQRVAIDTSKHLNGDAEPESTQNSEAKQVEHQEIAEESIKNNNSDQQVTSQLQTDSKTEPSEDWTREALSERFFKAKAIFSEAKNIQSRVLDDIQQGRPIDASSVVDVTNDTIESIFENPDALACVINIRSKDAYLLEHSISVSILISIFAKYLQFERATISELAVGAFLHDVGKIKVPDEILNKPSKLTPEEFKIIQTHVVYSSEIVNQTEGITSMSRNIVANHHEKLNGKGYPLAKRASDLDIYSRIITICDIFDALTAERVYKKGIAQVRAFAILRELASRGELDAGLVDQFIKCLGIYPVGSLVRLNSNKLAMVEKSNSEKPLKPIVRAFFSVNQNLFFEATEIDLAEDESQFIEQGVRADQFDLDMNKITEFLMSQG